MDRAAPYINHTKRIPKRLILSYIVDWIFIILIAIAGYLFSLVSPNHRPFSLVDQNISYPYVEKEKVSTSTLILVSLVAPALITLILSLLPSPTPKAPLQDAPPLGSSLWKRRLWDWNSAWMGLALALATALLLTSGLKNLLGKPRPDLLNRCKPDLQSLQAHAVGGYGAEVSEGILLVSWTICTQSSREILNDGFASFPSGHSSTAFAGLTYLTLYLCAKLALAIPYLLPQPPAPSATELHDPSATELHDLAPNTTRPKDPLPPATYVAAPFRNQGAAPPVYLLVLAFVPVGAAVYISAT
ncbi:Phosphatidic acid phosphatase type 2/haloperoxidase, partial [Lasallia pustulata]